MSIALWTLVVLIAMPYVLAGVSGYFRQTQLGSVDNNNPRQQAAQLEGAGARAVAAQTNAWEALAVYTATLVLAFGLGADPATLTIPALVLLAARVVHAVAYVSDIATLRSLAFMVGIGSCIWIIVQA